MNPFTAVSGSLRDFRHFDVSIKDNLTTYLPLSTTTPDLSSVGPRIIPNTND